MLRLEIDIAVNECRVFEHPGPLVLVGRDDAATLVLPDATLSRVHARLELGSDGFWSLIDLGSRNGCHVNGQRVQESVILATGDVIRFGQVRARVVVAGQPLDGAPATTSPGTSEGRRRRALTVGIAIAVLAGIGAFVMQNRGVSNSEADHQSRGAVHSAALDTVPFPPESGQPPVNPPEASDPPQPSEVPPPEQASPEPLPPEVTQSAEPDPFGRIEIELENGVTLRATVDETKSDAAFLWIRERPDTALRPLPRESVARVAGNPMRFDAGAAFQLRRSRAETVAAKSELLAWCLIHRLTAEATSIAQEVLAAEPDHAEANATLGRRRYLGRYCSPDELRAAGALIVDGYLVGSGSDREFLNRRFLAVFGRAPSAPEYAAALAEPLNLALVDRLGDPEAHRAFLARTLTVWKLDLGAQAELLGRLGADLAAGRVTWAAALIALAKGVRPSPTSDQVLDAFLGPAAVDQVVREAARKIYARERAPLFGQRPKNADELLQILVKQPSFFRYQLGQEHRRLTGRDLPAADLSRLILGLASKPEHWVEIRAEWLTRP